ncbi:MAG: hypothetical protein KGO96_09845 [Elusimicrobia bacterium]|nr:hypothetical protein [Elusimicrobiota bacterium]MDE2426191.1 hypothetical protein [Elusimicrobiota bacterium]
MSFKGEIDANCPNGCEAFAAEVWSFIHGERSPELRDALLWRECNLIICPGCGAAFVPEAAFVYLEAGAELLAFVFPASYRDREDYWRGKMRDDFSAMKRTLGGELESIEEPELFFGQEGLGELLQREDYRGEESEVMEHVARELGLGLYAVSRAYARRHEVPRALPYVQRPGRKPGVEAVVEGLRRVVEANERLSDCRSFLAKLERGCPLPPERAAKPA